MRTEIAAAAAAALALSAGAAAQVLYSNGPIGTGPTLSNGAPAPAGSQWSEVLTGNITLGWTVQRYADDVVLTGATALQAVEVYGFVTGAPTSPSPFTAGTLRIWNGLPDQTGSTVVFGNTTTNRFVSSSLVNILRTPWATPETTRQVWAIRLAAPVTLPPGTYWLDWSLNTGSVPPVTIAGQFQKPGSNAKYFLTSIGFWRNVADTNSGFDQDFPFALIGGGQPPPPCLPNCDASTAVPFLNVADFTCFLQKFAAADAYANCDASTTAPVLNVADFTCFLQKFAAGCSAP
jgi:hypothetical protein